MTLQRLRRYSLQEAPAIIMQEAGVASRLPCKDLNQTLGSPRSRKPRQRQPATHNRRQISVVVDAEGEGTRTCPIKRAIKIKVGGGRTAKSPENTPRHPNRQNRNNLLKKKETSTYITGWSESLPPQRANGGTSCRSRTNTSNQKPLTSVILEVTFCIHDATLIKTRVGAKELNTCLPCHSNLLGESLGSPVDSHAKPRLLELGLHLFYRGTQPRDKP